MRQPADTAFPAISLAGIRIDRLDFDEVVDAIIARARTPQEPAYVVTPNAQHLVDLQRDAGFRKIYEGAFLSVPDGVPLLWAARLFGTPLKGRVNGTDLLEAVCAAAAREGLRVFFLGGRPGAAIGAADVLTRRFAGLEICGTYCPPFGFENEATELDRVNEAIRLARPDILFVGLGAPKQERWIAAHSRNLGVPVSLGTGVSFEFVAGMVRRAPVWMQRSGLEWFHRLLSEPSRLWRRYLLGNARFVWLMVKSRRNPGWS